MNLLNHSASQRHLHLQQQQQPIMMNRSRTDSGSTFNSFSDSSSSNRSKSSQRRRSHRPRGCRGGSSRKKRRGGKVPNEIMGSSVSMKSSNNPADDYGYGTERKLSLPVSDENAGTVRATMVQQQKQWTNYMPLSSNLNRPLDLTLKGEKRAPITTSKVSDISCYMRNNSCGVPPNKMSVLGAEYCPVGNQVTQQILPPMHEHQEATEHHQIQGRNIYALQQAENSSYANGYSFAHNCMGNSNHGNESSFPSLDYNYRQGHPAAHGFYNSCEHSRYDYQFQKLEQLHHGKSNGHEKSHPDFHGVSQDNRTKIDHGFGAHTESHSFLPMQTAKCQSDRIDNQRQMIAEGGSLFVTSPRSFLMGWKSDDTACM